jgi:hypothetical protein
MLAVRGCLHYRLFLQLLARLLRELGGGVQYYLVVAAGWQCLGLQNVMRRGERGEGGGRNIDGIY